MLNNIVRFSGYQFHLEDTKMMIDGVQLVHYSFHLFIFLSNTVNTMKEGTCCVTDIQYKLSNDMLVR